MASGYPRGNGVAIGAATAAEAKTAPKLTEPHISFTKMHEEYRETALESDRLALLLKEEVATVEAENTALTLQVVSLREKAAAAEAHLFVGSAMFCSCRGAILDLLKSVVWHGKALHSFGLLQTNHPEPLGYRRRPSRISERTTSLCYR